MTARRNIEAPPFEPGALYATPLGRLAVYVPDSTAHRAGRDGYASFSYVQAGDSSFRRLADGFSLTAANWGLLRQVRA